MTNYANSWPQPLLLFRFRRRKRNAKNREVMGATNPADAEAGTIRAEFAQSVGKNSVHGSDAPETAAVEIAYFFSGLELVG